jgi:hypothetical protein
MKLSVRVGGERRHETSGDDVALSGGVAAGHEWREESAENHDE